jgi:hypothetical protein
VVSSGLRQNDALFALLFNFALGCVIGKDIENHDKLKLSYLSLVLVYAEDDVSLECWVEQEYCRYCTADQQER